MKTRKRIVRELLEEVSKEAESQGQAFVNLASFPSIHAPDEAVTARFKLWLEAN